MPSPINKSYSASLSAVLRVGFLPPAPVAEFVGSPVSGSTPLSVTFTDQSTGPISSWAWDFGDGGTSTVQSPVHAYAAAGTYTVVLTVTNAGGSSTRTRASYVTATGTGPTWIAAQAVNTWGTIPASNNLEALNPDNDPLVNPNYPGTAPWRSTGNFSTIVTAWNGAAFDDGGGVLWWNDAGGHGDKWDNGHYKLDLNRPVPLYTRVLAPSGSVGFPTVAYPEFSGSQLADYSDGRGRAKHTYNYPFYIPGVGPGLATEITLAPSGGTASGSFRLQTFNESTGARTLRANGAAELGSGCAACYDPTNDAVWKRPVGNAPMRKWDRATDVWSNVGPDQNYSGPWSLAPIPGHNCVLMGNGSDDGLGQSIAGGWQVFDCATGTYYTPTFTGAPSLGVANNNGLWPGMCQPRWSSYLGCFLVWDNSSNTTKVMTLTPGADPRVNNWTIGELTVSGSNSVTPSVAAVNGTYGRFFVWDAQRICGVVNSASETGYFFRYG